MGLCRNCGIYDIVMWASMKLFGIGNESFPLKSVALLDELNTIAAVDSVSEMMATLGLLCLTIGEATASSLNGEEACGAIVVCDADGVPTKSFGGAAAICLAAFVFRAGFFVLERSAFRKIMKNASNIESNALSMAKTVGTLKKATKKPKEAPQEGVQSRSMSAHLHQVSKSDIKDHANVDVTALINDVVVMMESDNWKHWYFIKESRVSVQRYMKFRGDTSEAHSIYMKLKGSFLSRSTMMLKTSVAELLEYHLDYLNPAKIPEGGSREILEGEGTSRRILHYKVPTPWPLKPLDSVFLELVHEYEIDGRRVAHVCCGPCTHPSKPKEKGVVRLDSILFADFYEELEDGSSRWTVLQAFNPKLPLWIRWLTRGEAKKFTTESISLYTRKWERDTRSDRLVQELEDKNAEKLNIANTLSNIFTGSKLFLSLASMVIIYQHSMSNMMRWKQDYWEEYWIASGLCNSTSSD
ncbi:hypothetical protein TrVE_jg5997 [Triparma verrucosa]|uniref:Uncharacterized protein n=1 Tax=Triparma verrucosa TaxID=1606542 RepID=A0A9W7BQB9_9STRA|nr:hypothetical protein TrVE_jg5997 [Triparma verrucosa]